MTQQGRARSEVKRSVSTSQGLESHKASQKWLVKTLKAKHFANCPSLADMHLLGNKLKFDVMGNQTRDVLLMEECSTLSASLTTLSECHGKCQNAMGNVRMPWEMSECHGKCRNAMGNVRMPWEMSECHGKCQNAMRTVHMHVQDLGAVVLLLWPYK